MKNAAHSFLAFLARYVFARLEFFYSAYAMARSRIAVEDAVHWTRPRVIVQLRIPSGLDEHASKEFKASSEALLGERARVSHAVIALDQGQRTMLAKIRRAGTVFDLLGPCARRNT